MLLEQEACTSEARSGRAQAREWPLPKKPHAALARDDALRGAQVYAHGLLVAVARLEECVIRGKKQFLRSVTPPWRQLQQLGPAVFHATLLGDEPLGFQGFHGSRDVAALQEKVVGDARCGHVGTEQVEREQHAKLRRLEAELAQALSRDRARDHDRVEERRVQAELAVFDALCVVQRHRRWSTGEGGLDCSA